MCLRRLIPGSLSLIWARVLVIRASVLVLFLDTLEASTSGRQLHARQKKRTHSKQERDDPDNDRSSVRCCDFLDSVQDGTKPLHEILGSRRGVLILSRPESAAVSVTILEMFRFIVDGGPVLVELCYAGVLYGTLLPGGEPRAGSHPTRQAELVLFQGCQTRPSEGMPCQRLPLLTEQRSPNTYLSVLAPSPPKSVCWSGRSISSTCPWGLEDR